MLTVLHDNFKEFADVPFLRANILYVEDKWFLERMWPHATKLDALFKQLRFYDPSIANDFATLSSILPIRREDDVLVDQFVRGGKALPELYRHCVAVVGALPINESIVELTFSAEKTVHRPNESRQETSHELQYQQNTVALLRSERSLMSSDSKNNGNHHTLAQIHKAGEQMLGLIEKYSCANMSDVGARRAYHGDLKGADDAQAEAAVDMKLEERMKQAARKTPSALVLRKRQLELSSNPTKHEKELAIIGRVTDDDRRSAVVSEVKFRGQVGSAAIFFSTFKAADQRRLLQAALPLCFGIARALTAPTRVPRKQPTASAVLKLVRCIRDLLLQGLLPFLSDCEKQMMGAMRIGVLRTTAGIPEVDEAVRARTTKTK